MKKVLGFARYTGLDDVVMLPSVPLPEHNVVKSPEDIILDSIFCKDENGFPCTSYAKLMSNKTSDEIRKYIQDNILVCKSENHLISDENVLQEFKKLDSEFLAQASRNRYETVEQYENRITQYIEQSRSEAAAKSRLAKYRKLFQLDDKDK